MPHIEIHQDKAADNEAVHGIINFGGKLSGFADKLKGNRMNVAVLDFRDYGNSAPEGFIHALRLFIFDILKNSVAFFDAETAHAARRADGELSVNDLNGSERTDGN